MNVRLAQALGIVALFVLAMGYSFHAGQKWKQAEWDRERVRLESAARQLSEDYRQMEAAWQRENVRIVGAYREELDKREAALADERARGVDLGRRLLRVSADLASRDRAAQEADSSGTSGAAPVSSSEAEIARLVERGREAVNAIDTACSLDAAQLVALQDVVR